MDIRSVVVDTSLPPEQRMMDYLEKIKNPYCFRCGDAVVSIHFADKGNSLDSLLKNCLLYTSAAGSDAGAYRVPHVQGLRDERALLHRALGADAARILDAGEAEIRRKFKLGGADAR